MDMQDSREWSRECLELMDSADTQPKTQEAPTGPEREDSNHESSSKTMEEVTISGDTLVVKVKELIQQGNIRRLILKSEKGHTLMEIPLTVGVAGSVLIATIFPVIAAIGVIGAMMTHVTIVIERQKKSG